MKVSDQIAEINQNISRLKIDYESRLAVLSAALNETKALTNKVVAPIHLESDILATAQEAISKSIMAVLVNYDSPLNKLVKVVIENHNQELKTLINDAFTSVIRTEEFKQSIVSAFSHKISRTIISNNDGLFDKVSNELKQDQIFKAKMSLAVANVVEECLKNKNLQ
jgi:hypothetical protein